MPGAVSELGTDAFKNKQWSDWMTLIIGLTGSIGTGKSTVSHMFKEEGIPVVDADVIAREVVEPDREAYRGIIDAFGSEVIHADGRLNRKALGAIVFSDDAKRRQLNAIIHPAIRAEMLRQRDALVATGVRFVVLDIPLLFESKLRGFVEKVIVVAVDPAIQLGRLMTRDGSTADEANLRIKAQIPIDEKAKLADAVIDNNGSLENTRSQLDEILSGWATNH